MPSQFEYTGVERSGRAVKGLIEGESPMDVVLKLKGDGIKVYSVQKTLLPREHSFVPTRKLSASALALFNEQLAALLKTKLPLPESLRHLSKEMRSARLKRVSQKIGERLESGKSFSASIAEHRDFFPPLYVNMVEAGEKSGDLSEVLYHVASYYRSVENLKRMFTGALLYPSMLTILSLAVLFFLIKLMVPPYVDMYSSFHIGFPPLLKSLVFVEQVLRMNVLFVIGLGGLAALIALAPAAKMSKALRHCFGALALRIPVWGEMIKDAILAQSIGSIAILLRSGVPLCESLNTVKDLVSDGPLKDAYETAAAEALEGQTLSQSLIRQTIFPLEVVSAIRNGETSGELLGALENAKRMCQGKLELRSRIVLSVLEPTLLVVLGIIIIFIVVSLFYPLYSLSKYLGV